MAIGGEVVLTELVEPDGDQFAAYCLELGTASCGDTIEEAFANLEEAIWVHLNELEAIGERERVFQENNIVIMDRRSKPHEASLPPVPLGKMLKATAHKVPVTA